MDITIYIAVIVAIIVRLVIMKGTFVLPTFYRNGNELSFNLGSVMTIIIGLAAAFALMYAQPELFSNWYVAAVTAYTAPQIVDGVMTAGTRFNQGPKEQLIQEMADNIMSDTPEVSINDDEEEGGA